MIMKYNIIVILAPRSLLQGTRNDHEHHWLKTNGCMDNTLHVCISGALFTLTIESFDQYIYENTVRTNQIFY